MFFGIPIGWVVTLRRGRPGCLVLTKLSWQRTRARGLQKKTRKAIERSYQNVSKHLLVGVFSFFFQTRLGKIPSLTTYFWNGLNPPPSLASASKTHLYTLQVYGYGAYSCPPCLGLMTWRNPIAERQNASFTLRKALSLPQARNIPWCRCWGYLGMWKSMEKMRHIPALSGLARWSRPQNSRHVDLAGSSYCFWIFWKHFWILVSDISDIYVLIYSILIVNDLINKIMKLDK